jgi:nucleotide-binding universal stress UspA family protein
VIASGAGGHLRVHVRRILLALDTTGDDPAAMERAAALAARLRGELIALYVQDIDLVRLAEHTSVSALSTVTAAPPAFATGHLREALRLQAARLRRELERAAVRRQVKWAFQVRQGRLLAETLNLADDDDLLVIAWAHGGARPPWATTPPPATILQALVEARVRSVLLLHPTSPAGGGVLIGFDGSDTAWRALSIGAQVAELDASKIEVALLAGRVDEAESCAADIGRAVAGTGLDVACLHTPKAGLAVIAGIARLHRSGLLVLDAERILAEDDSDRLLQRVPCSVLLVR